MKNVFCVHEWSEDRCIHCGERMYNYMRDLEKELDECRASRLELLNEVTKLYKLKRKRHEEEEND